MKFNRDVVVANTINGSESLVALVGWSGAHSPPSMFQVRKQVPISIKYNAPSLDPCGDLSKHKC